jgi:hypothetical protein
MVLVVIAAQCRSKIAVNMASERMSVSARFEPKEGQHSPHNLGSGLK